MEKERLREMCRKFFKKIELSEKLKIPKSLKWVSIKIAVFQTIQQIIGISFSFLLTFTNVAIEAKMILLGIILFMLYNSRSIIMDVNNLYNNIEREKNNSIMKKELVCTASSIIGVVSGKVVKYDSKTNMNIAMTNERILNSIRNYLEVAWKVKIYRGFDVLDIICTIAMLIGAVITNKELPLKIFIPMLAIFSVIAIICSVYISKVNDENYKKNRKYNEDQSIILNDILRTSEVVFNKDIPMRTELLKKTIEESAKNSIKHTKKKNINLLIMTIFNTLSQYGIIILYLIGIDWNSINIGTIAEITAILAITQTAIRRLEGIFRTLENIVNDIKILEQEEQDIKLIMEVYNKEIKNYNSLERIYDMNIPEFEVRYLETSENDKPFTLTLKKPITITWGSIVIEYGTSGSGKSTFSKMIAQKINLIKSEKVPSTSRFLYYDETLKFGSLTIYEELFCFQENPDFLKMKDILENLGLWQEINRTCHDIWRWMKEKKYNNSLSNGQKQRLILAKMLYWLDDSIDVAVLDEATSGLDDKNSDGVEASKILEYVVKFINKDKKRTVFISTHQDISQFINRMTQDGYEITILRFKQNDDYNIIEMDEKPT